MVLPCFVTNEEKALLAVRVVVVGGGVGRSFPLWLGHTALLGGHLNGQVGSGGREGVRDLVEEWFSRVGRVGGGEVWRSRPKEMKKNGGTLGVFIRRSYF